MLGIIYNLFDKIFSIWYVILFVIIISRISRETWHSYVNRLVLALRCGFMSKHIHEWGIWGETNKHHWSHAKTMYRICNKCSQDEYRLIELLCPQFKIKKVYCYWCEPYAKEWSKRLKQMVFDGLLDIPLGVSYSELMKQMKKGTRPEALTDRNKELYKFILEGNSFQAAAEKFDISKARAYELFNKFEKKIQKVA